MASPVAQFLASPASVLGHIGSLKTIDASKNLHEALKVFGENKVYALPVQKNGHLVGLITIKSIVAQLLEEFYSAAKVAGKSSTEKESGLSNHNFPAKEIEEITAHFAKKHVGDFVDITTKPLPENATVHDVINALQATDRVAVADSHGKLSNIYSQSGVLKYLNTHVESLGTIADHEIGKIPHLVTHPVKVIDGSVRAIVALSVMVEQKFSSVGFTNEEKDVEGVLSFKDVRAAAADISLLLGPVADYVNEIRRTDTDNLLRDVVPTVNCSSSDSLKKVIGKLTAVGIHRLFVREKEEKGYHFSGIITLSDVLKLVLRSK